MLSRVVVKKRRGRRLFTALAVASIVAGTFIAAGTVLAVHDLDFQLDGDVSVDCPTPATVLPLCTSAQKDWTDMFSVSTNATTQTISLNTPISTTNGTFTDATFTRDFRSGPNCTTDSSVRTFCTSDTTTYATGSKDTLDISAGWACNKDNNVNSKIDIMNAYSAAFTRTSDGHKFLYFGLEKNKDNGTNDAGFWFLQGDANCDATGGGHPPFTGQHVIGDILIVAEYSTGGGVGNITAYRWNGTTPLVQIASAVAPLGDCKNTTGSDALCATTNSGAKAFNGNISTPWLTSDATLKVGTTVVPPDFFEGGIDLTAAFSGTGTPPPSCFNTFIGDTRSSTSLTATLFDYARGSLGQCHTELSTQENAAASRTIGTNGTIDSGTDTATLDISGSTTWNGLLTWYLCGPDVTTCDSHGVVVDTLAVHSTDASHAYTNDDTATLTSAGAVGATNRGQYCWHAHFEPDAASKLAGIGAGDDDGTNECFTVTPRTPTLSTSASCSASPCVLGSTLSDTANLGNTANNPKNDGAGGDTGLYKSINGTTQPAGGTITWTLFGPANDGSAQCTTSKTLSPNTAAVTGDNAAYGPVSYATNHAGDIVGKYTFAASYPGEGPNTNAAASVTCAAAGQNNATGEQITVTGSVGSSSVQGWLPNDRITVTSTAGTSVSGSVVATLYRGTFTGTAADCGAGTATSVYTQTLPVSSATNTATVFTTNTGTFIGTRSDTGAAGQVEGNYFWLIHLNISGLSNAADRCENTNIDLTD